jgi:uncharacterized protein (TIGR03086 family)
MAEYCHAMAENPEETQPADPLEILALARLEFERRVADVGVEQFDGPTPCDDWTVRDLIDHVMAGDIFATRVLAGATIEEAVDGLSGVDLVGIDPLPAFRRGATAVAAAFARPGALESIVHHPIGDITGATFLEFRITDYVGHAWDLARAAGQDEHLDTDLVAWLGDAVSARTEMLSTSAHFGGGHTGDLGDATAQHRLLDALGRRP